MSKLPLDLSKFRKIKSDKETTTFKHHEGHTITVAHNKLSSKLREHIGSLKTHEPKNKEMPETQKFADGSPGVSDSGDIPYNQLIPQEQQNNAPYGTMPISSNPELQGMSQDQGQQPSPDQFSTAAAPMNFFQGQMNALQGQKEAAQELGSAQGSLGKEQAGIEQGYQQTLQDNMQKSQAAIQPYIEQYQKLSGDIMNGHVDPQRFVKNMSTGDKIQNGIGQILGGIGAGLTHGPNLAFQYMQNQINNDIDSQKAELGKKQNLLSHNIQMMGNTRAGIELTRLQQNAIVQSQLRMAGDKAAPGIAQAQAHGVASMFDGKMADIARQGALFNMIGGGGQLPGAALELLPPEQRERAVQLPGGGIKLGVTKEGAKEVREQIQTIQPIFDQLDQLQKLGPSALIPGTAANQEAKARQAQLIPMINENAGLKRLSGEDIGNIKQMITDPTRFSSLLSGAKTNSFKGFLQDKLLNTMSNQLEGGAPRSQQHAAPPETQMRGGKQYQKVPGGWKLVK